MRPALILAVASMLVAANVTIAAEDPDLDVDAYNQCLLEKMRTAAD